VRGYDLETGATLWECGGLSGNVVASPVAADGIVYVANSYDGQAMLAIRLDAAKGDVTGTDAVAWSLSRNTPYVPSPLLYEGRIFFVKHLQSFLSAADARTGKILFGPARLPVSQMIFASPVGAAGRVYVVGRGGVTTVLESSDRFEVLAVNRLDDTFSASPALAGDELYLRGERYLYSLSMAASGGS
jgi:outer membrane protein assembly factor BamB